jgi:predicted GNAT family N-acyltransferase
MENLPEGYSFIDPMNPAWSELYFRLRWEVLRAPWKQPFGSERDDLEEQCFHVLIAYNGQEAVACGRVQMNDEETAQVRYMAVHPAHQGKHLGSQVLNSLELYARELGARRIILQARENALPFYKANSYHVLEKTFVLFGSIPHYLMQKEI